MIEQLAFDIDTLIEEVNPPPAYTGRAPLHFTVTAFTPGEYMEAEDHLREIGEGFGIHVGPPHIWHKGYDSSLATPGHSFTVLAADLGCEDYGRDSHRFAFGRRVCSCVGGRVNRGHCECGWASEITADGSAPVEAWHDHAWPGWRDLPVIPKGIRPASGGITKTTKAAYAWVIAHYPTEWQKPGAPVITERAGIGTRHVSGYSPWGGYDLAAESLGIDIERAA